MICVPAYLVIFFSITTFVLGAPTTTNPPTTDVFFKLRLDEVASGFPLDWQGGTDIVSWANGTLWIGGIKYQTYSEPFIALGSADLSYSLLFTSYHAAPTGGEFIEFVPNVTGPVYTTSPGEPAPPGGQPITGLDFDSNNRLNYGGKYKFVGCQNAIEQEMETYQIWWMGGGPPPNGTVCTKHLFLYKDRGCP